MATDLMMSFPFWTNFGSPWAKTIIAPPMTISKTAKGRVMSKIKKLTSPWNITKKWQNWQGAVTQDDSPGPAAALPQGTSPV